MANLLDLIREIQGGSPNMMQDAEAVVDDSGTYDAGIQVTGTVPRALPVDQSQYLLNQNAPDLRNTEWAQAAVDARNENDKKVEHKGMFGVKGTLRNVLGVLGDAFLIQGGAKPIYAPTRQREREGDAMAGYTQSPRSAVERMTAVNPELAQNMGDSVARQELARAQQEAIQAQRRAALREKGIGIVSQFLGADGMSDPETYKRFRPQIQKIIDQYGLSDVYNLPEEYDPSYSSVAASAGLDPAQRAADQDRDASRSLTEQRNAALTSQGAARIAEQQRHNRAMEARPTSSGRPQQPTEAAEIARIRAKVDNGTPLKPGEKATWENYLGKGSKSGGRSGRRPVTTQSRFRRLN